MPPDIDTAISDASYAAKPLYHSRLPIVSLASFMAAGIARRFYAMSFRHAFHISQLTCATV